MHPSTHPHTHPPTHPSTQCHTFFARKKSACQITAYICSYYVQFLLIRHSTYLFSIEYLVNLNVSNFFSLKMSVSTQRKLVLLLAVIFLSLCDAFCPHLCECDDALMVVTCPAASQLDVIPITLNPMIR